MSEKDRQYWDRRYAEDSLEAIAHPGPPPVFAPHENLFPSSGDALELACGRGRGAIWLAGRGLHYSGVDVSPIAIDMASQLVASSGLSDRCRLAVHDLDEGLPEGNPVDLIFCYLFRDPRLDQPMIERLKPGGLLAIAVLSEVDAGPGRFRAKPGELVDAFSDLEISVRGEADGMASLIARKH